MGIKYAHTEHNPKEDQKEDQKEIGRGGMGSMVKKAAGSKGSVAMCVQGAPPCPFPTTAQRHSPQYPTSKVPTKKDGLYASRSPQNLAQCLAMRGF